MKKLRVFPWLILALGLFACNTGPAAVEEVAPAAGTDPVIKTSIGEFEIASARFVDEINGAKPGQGEKILLIILAQPGGGKLDQAAFSLEAFDKAVHDTSKGEVHITGDDGSYAISTMAGWMGENVDEFAMGFRVPSGAKTFQLFWPENQPVMIVPVN